MSVTIFWNNMLGMTSLSIVLFLLFLPMFLSLYQPENLPKDYTCATTTPSPKKNPHPHAVVIPSEKKNSNPGPCQQKVVGGATSHPRRIPQPTYPPKCYCSTGGFWSVNRSSQNGFVRVQPGFTGWTGCPWKIIMDHHLALWKKSFLEIVEFTRYITTWLPDKSFLIGFNPYF